MLIRLQLRRLIDFDATRHPVGKFGAAEIGFEPIEVRMGAAEEAAGVAYAQPSMCEPEQGAVAVSGQLVAHHAVLNDRLLPFVLENIGWIPHQDASRHPLSFGR